MMILVPSFCWILSTVQFVSGLDPPKQSESKSAAKLPPCGACTNLVTSFEAGMERTKRGKLEGGDAAWEEKSGQRYATSEVRLAEITEQLCKDVGRGETQCHINYGDWEEDIETWWAMEPDTRPELRQWLCVDKLEVCCPQDHFGPDCAPCQVLGDNGKVCSGNGKCKGGGTRKGNGKCQCNSEYTGEQCDQCSEGHYQSFKDENKLLCSSCHKSCSGHCSGAGPKACTVCAKGYIMNTEHGCMDTDECIINKPCPRGKFCVNNEGSYRCVNCDKACDGCDADGPDNCLRCASGYSLKNKFCVADKMASGKIFNIDNTRFFTYAGLVVATCIILHKNFVVASVVGVVVAVYISFTEYYLANNDISGDLQPTPATLDTIKQQFQQGNFGPM